MTIVGWSELRTDALNFPSLVRPVLTDDVVTITSRTVAETRKALFWVEKFWRLHEAGLLASLDDPEVRERLALPLV